MVKITQPGGGIGGVQLEIDGFVVPELVDVTVKCPVDSLVTITADVFATSPFEVEFSKEVNVVFKNSRLAEAARRVLAVIEHEAPFTAASPACRELETLLGIE